MGAAEHCVFFFFFFVFFMFLAEPMNMNCPGGPRTPGPPDHFKLIGFDGFRGPVPSGQFIFICSAAPSL